VIAFVANHVFTLANERADYSQVHLEAGAIQQHSFFVNQARQSSLQLQMDIQRTVEKPRTGATGSIFGNRCYGGFFYLWVVRQAKVAVGAEHQHSLAFDQHLRILR